MFIQLKRNNGRKNPPTWTIVSSSNSRSAIPERDKCVIIECHFNTGWDKMVELAEEQWNSR